MAAGLLIAGTGIHAQDAGKTAPAAPPASSGTTTAPAGNANAGKPGTAPAPTVAAATMQIKREITGNFQYRFVTTADQSAALLSLPATASANNIVPLAIPKGYDGKGASLEIVDLDHSRVANFPVTSTVLTLNESSFQYVQTVLVPVNVKGKGGLTGGVVTLASGDKSYSKSVILSPADAGTARFSNVPLGKPITVTVTEGTNAPLSVTQTLTTPATGEGFKFTPIEVNWPDAHTVPLPAAPALGAASAPATSGAAIPPAPPLAYPPAVAPPYPTALNNSESPLSGIVSTVVSLLFLGGVGYVLYWAYQNGHLKNMLDKLGIQTQPVAAGGPQPSPFDKPQRTPIQPITDGTSDALVGGGSYAGAGAFAAAPVASSGPRLVGTMGTYAGSIFPLAGTALVIGRDAGNPIALPDDTNASRRHATVQLAGSQATVTDNGSSNGTFVNGVRIAAQSPYPLNMGDEVQIGMTRFRFEN